MAMKQAPLKDTTELFVVTDENAESKKRRASGGMETDPHRLEQRQRQITFGKNTLGYANYRKAVPKVPNAWPKRDNKQPTTPDIHQICSKRAFDGQVRKWRRLLHQWDPTEGDGDYEEGHSVPTDAAKQPAKEASGILRWADEPEWDDEEVAKEGVPAPEEPPGLTPELATAAAIGQGSKREHHPGTANLAKAVQVNAKKRRQTAPAALKDQAAAEAAAGSIYDDWDEEINV